MVLQRGARLGPYEILAPLGAGGMGEVYRAHDPRLGRDVAIKVLPAEFSADADRLQRFEQEARAAASLNHPHILAVYDIGTDSGSLYVVSELLEGQTLRASLSDGSLPVRKAVEYARQIADGLAAAHAQRIAHRDLKPENLFVTSEGRVKILDFGLAKRATPAPSGEMPTATFAGLDTAAGVIVGTVGYMSPEQARGKAVDHRCDQFSFGVVLFELLSGRRTFARPTGLEELAAIIRDDPPSLAEMNPDVPLPLQWLVSRCLAKDPADRYQSTRDLARDLDTMSTHLGQMTTSAAVPDVHNVPVPRTSLVGRDADLATAKEILLREAVRLVTFTGAGGIGKTRLALQVAHDLRDQFEGGVYFVGLSSIADPALVPPALAQAFGVRTVGAASLVQALKDHLERMHGRPMLLVLDNFEHVLDAAPIVAELLATTATIKVLATSREALNLYEEHEFPVLPLARPDPARFPSLESLRHNPAIALFVERAVASKPTFTLTADNARVVVEICNRLDGLPLAIELAAARVKTLPPATLLGRMQSRLHLLTGGARDLPARQQTLRGAIDWSHGLLGEAEQRLFRRISCFVGGCSFEAAEAVCDTKQDLGIDLVDGIESLVNKSLLQQTEQPDGEARLSMLETIREYGLERLTENMEEQGVRQAHAAYFLVLAEEAATELEGREQARWLVRLDQDLDNLRVALEWLTRTENAEWGLRLGAALFRYWEARELLTEGRERLAALLRLPGAAGRTLVRAKAAFAAGVLAWTQRDYSGGFTLHYECLDIYRELGDRPGTAITLNALGVVSSQKGEFAEARTFFEESCTIWQELGDRPAVARGFSNLANLLKDEGNYALARSHQERSFAIFSDLGDTVGAAWSLNQQGDLARAQGDLAGARQLYEQALASFKALDDTWGLASSLADLGRLAIDEGNLDAAHSLMRQSLDLFQRLGHKRGLARLLEGFARIAACQGEAGRALKLAGAAAALRKSLGTPPTSAEQRRLDQILRPMEAQLKTAERSRAWLEGWAMPIEEAMEYAVSGGTA